MDEKRAQMNRLYVVRIRQVFDEAGDIHDRNVVLGVFETFEHVQRAVEAYSIAKQCLVLDHDFCLVSLNKPRLDE